jgi:hypothetical protein
VCLACLAIVTGETQPPPDKNPPAKADSNFSFMSGTVSEILSDSITITRNVAGKASEKHTFQTTAETTIEGKLKVKARVTIGYVKGEDTNTAVRIIVRSSSPPAPKK